MNRQRFRDRLLEILESRRVLAAPSIGSLNAIPEMPDVGSAITARAENVADTDGDLVHVEFFADDGDGVFTSADPLVGVDHTSSDGWDVTFSTNSPYRILTLGDSITQPSGEYQSYRYPLWKGLVDDGYAFDFIGTQTTNRNGNIPNYPDYLGNQFDLDHEGHSGWTADQIKSALPNWLDSYTPDIALVHLGTNDVFQGHSIESTVSDLAGIVETLRRDNPSVTVFVAQLIPTDSASNTTIESLNALLPAAVSEWDQPESPVILVDQNTGFDANLHTYDGVHPNVSGQEQMASVWLDAIVGNTPLADPAEAFAGNDVTLFAVATDAEGNEGEPAQLDLQFGTTDPSIVHASWEESIYGDPTGNLVRLQDSDNHYLELAEKSTSATVRRVLHEWHFDVPEGNAATLAIEAFRSTNAETFYINYSTDRDQWSNLSSVGKTADDDQAERLPLPDGTSGSVWIRIVDGNPFEDASTDTVFVDAMAIEVEESVDTLSTVSVSVAGNANESGPSNGEFIITRTGDTTEALTVSYGVGGTATSGVDYSSLAGSVTFPIGVTEVSVDVAPLDDDADEGAESVSLSLSNSPSYDLGTSTAELFILDDDGVVPTRYFPVSESSLAGSATGFSELSLSDDSYQVLSEANDALLHIWEFEIPSNTSAKLFLESHSSTAAEGYWVNYSLDGRFYRNMMTISNSVDSDVAQSYALPEGASGRISIKVRDTNRSEGNPDSLFVDQLYIDVELDGSAPVLPEVNLSAVSDGSESGPSNGEFIITRTGDTTESLTVSYGVGGTATSGVDYSSLAGSVIIPVGASQVSVTVATLDDDDVESNETVELTLSADAAYDLGTQVQAAVSIADNDVVLLPEVNLSAVSDGSESGPSNGEFIITRTGDTTESLTVSYGVGGTATSGVDYSSLAGSVMFPIGVTEVSVDVAPLDDDADEGAESVSLSLSNSPSYDLGTSTAELFILDDDGVVPTRYFPVSESSLAGSATGFLELNLSDDSYQVLSEANDALLHIWEFEIPSNTSAKVFLESHSSTAAEGYWVNYSLDGRFYRNMMTISNSVDSDVAQSYALPEGASGRIYIKVRDTNRSEGNSDSLFVDQLYIDVELDGSAPVLPEVNLSAVSDGAESGPSNGEFIITRTGDTTESLTVSYGVGGTATSGVDYSSLAGSVIIPVGASQVSVTVATLDDDDVESNETVELTLSADAAYDLGTQVQAAVSIADNDVVLLPEVNLSAVSDGSESGPSNGEFIITRTGDTTESLTVSYGVGGTATSGVDYSSLAGSVIIPVGASQVSVTVATLDDDDVESNETVELTLSADAAYDLGTQVQAAVSIADNDVVLLPEVNLSAVSDGSESGPSNGEFIITRTGDTTESLTVSYGVGGTATSGVDYSSLAGSVIIPVGASQVSVTVATLDDDDVESNETVELTLSADAAYDLGTQVQAAVSIADNDVVLLPEVNLSAVSDGSESGPSNGEFIITRTGDTTEALTVSYGVGGTATSGVDYSSLAGSVIIPVGASQVSVTVATLDDDDVESNETVELTLSADAAYDLGTQVQAAVSIADNDVVLLPEVNLSAVSDGAESGPSNGEFIITRTGDTTESLTVSYGVGGTATSGVDYSSLAGSVIIPVGASQVSVTVATLDDDDVESNETVELTLSADAAYDLGTQVQAAVSIADNDLLATTRYSPVAQQSFVGSASGLLDLGASDDQYQLLTEDADELWHVWEFEIPSNTGATFSLEAYSSTDAEGYWVNYSLDGRFYRNMMTVSNSTDNDVAQTYEFPAGTSGQVFVKVRDTNRSEGNSDVLYVDSAVIDVEYDDAVPIAPDVSIVAIANGAETGPSNGNFHVTRSGSTTLPLVVSYTLGGTAASGVDYAALTGSVTIPAGEAETSIVIIPIDDLQDEGSETVVATLVAAQEYRIDTDQAEIEILDDDGVIPTRYFPAAENSRLGSATGSDNLLGSDNAYQVLSESGNDALWHIWEFDIPANSVATFSLEAFSSTSAEGYWVNYSLDGLFYRNMLTVSNVSDSDQAQTYELPAQSGGPVYVAVRDSNRAEQNVDALFVDQVFIDVELVEATLP